MWSILTDPDVQYSLWLTAKTALIDLGLFCVVVPPLAWALARHPGLWQRITSFVVTLPLVFPPIALGYLLLVVFGRFGPIGQYLEAVGLPLLFTQTGVIVAGFVAGLPLVIRPVESALGSKGLQDLEAAARVHGLSNTKILTQITFPLIRVPMATGLLLGCARVTGEVGITLMLGGNIAGRTNTLSLEIFNAVGRADYDVANVLCAILVSLATLLFIAMENVRKRSVQL